jgi:hypothetical protein
VLPVGLLAFLIAVTLRDRDGTADQTGGGRGGVQLGDIPFNGQRAYEFLQRICALGPRFSGSEGMRRQREMLADHFRQVGGEVELQEFSVRHPEDGREISLANLIVHWHPQREERILLCAHYDTRPFPDRDPNPQRRLDPFIGANDGASGVALLAELAHLMPNIQCRYGIDFVLFDAEEFVFVEDRDPYFLGAEYFARRYVATPPPYRYRWGVLFDMVADARLEVFQERHSMLWRDTRPLVQDIWRTARRLGVREFVPKVRYEVRDDHLPLHDIAGIPTCDVIDFEYGPRVGENVYWHTTEDTPDKCSALSLAKVGWVITEWLHNVE